MNYQTKKYALRLFLILVAYLVLFMILGFLFLFDSIATASQLSFSALHLSFIYVTYVFLLKNQKWSKKLKYLILFTVCVFIVLNLIPSVQDFIAYDNGFMPAWDFVGQIKYGWPFTILRHLSDDIKLFLPFMGEYLIHWDNILCNIFCLTLIISIESLIGNWIKMRTSSDKTAPNTG